MTYYSGGYDPADVFPGAMSTKEIDMASICEYLDASRDIPVVYSFGGGAPGNLEMMGREILNARFAGPIGGVVKPGSEQWAGRVFVEYSPTSWNPESPDYAPD